MKGKVQMKKLILLLLTIISSLFIITNAYASDYILQYDGITEEYTGSIYKLMINDEFVETTVPPIIFNDFMIPQQIPKLNCFLLLIVDFVAV